MAEATALTLPEALPPDRQPARVYLAQLRPGSRRTMQEALEIIARTLTKGRTGADHLAWHELRYQHVLAVRTALQAKYAASTVTKMMSALRRTLREARRLGLMDAKTYMEAVDLEALKRPTPLPRGRALEDDELYRLFKEVAYLSEPVRSRDAALLALAFGAGLRRQELVDLDYSRDYDRDRGRLSVLGKGNVPREVFLRNGAKDAVHDWLRVRGADAGPLLLAVVNDHIRWTRLTTQAVYARMAWLAERAGVAKFSPPRCPAHFPLRAPGPGRGPRDRSASRRPQ
jgi:integrase/recombinase XerD